MKIIKRNDGRFVASVQFNNNRKYFYGATKSEAEKKAIEYVSLHNKGIELSSDNLTISKLCDEWFELYQRKNALSTQIRVRGIIDNYIKPEIRSNSCKIT